MTGDIYEAEIIKEELKDKGDLFATGLIEAPFGNKDQALEYFQRIEYWDDWETLSVHHLYANILGPLKKDERFNEILKKVHKSRGLEKNVGSNIA